MNILTFDLEDWFHLLEQPSATSVEDWEMRESRFPANMDRVLAILQNHNQQAVFFCMGWIARRYPHILKKIALLGHEVGCHSNMHMLINTQTPKLFRQMLRDGITSIEDITGTPVKSYRAPGFSLTKETLWAFEILAENGIEYDCSIFPANRSHGGYPDFPVSMPCGIRTHSGMIRELPVNVHPLAGRKVIFSGGGYFRILPYPVIRRLTKKSDYIMSYFHPRDFDPGQPMVSDLPITRKFKSYVGLRGAQKKFERWLDEFEFTDLRKAVETIDWTSVPIFLPDPDQKKLIISVPPVSPESIDAAASKGNTMQLMGFTLSTHLKDIVFPITGQASRVMINTMNPHSYILAKKDSRFREALLKSDVLIPDGIGIVIAAWILKFKRIHKIAGADLHEYLLKKLDAAHGSCFYLGASRETLDLIRDRLAKEYPNIAAGFYSPPYKEEFTEEDSRVMISTINSEIAKWRNGENQNSEQQTANSEYINSPPHQFTNSPVLFIGMTAPKQEKWSFQYRDKMNAAMICNIGAVFDFYAGTVKRSSPFWIKIGFEWLPRFLQEPRRLYRRVFISGPLFIWDVLLYRLGFK